VINFFGVLHSRQGARRGYARNLLWSIQPGPLQMNPIECVLVILRVPMGSILRHQGAVSV